MWIDLPALWIVVINCLGIPAVHLLVAWGSLRLPARLFRSDRFFCRVRRWELDGKLYHRLLRFRQWKDRLPDAAPWLAGFSKRSLRSTDPDYLRIFIAETRRGEWSHWIQWFGIAGFIAWNPFPANLVIIAYSMISNLPCILNLRLTRGRLERLLTRKSQAVRHSAGGASSSL